MKRPNGRCNGYDGDVYFWIYPKSRAWDALEKDLKKTVDISAVECYHQTVTVKRRCQRRGKGKA